MSEELRERFAELRAHEQQEAPSFDGVLSATLARTTSISRARPRRVRFAIAATIAAAAGIAVLMRPRPIERQETPLSITNWKAPTDVLLHTPGSDLLSDLPSLNESVLNIRGAP